jgi:hypothetical protein
MKNEKKDEWKADPKLTMIITNPFTKKDWLLVSSFVIVVSCVVVGLNFLFTGGL